MSWTERDKALWEKKWAPRLVAEALVLLTESLGTLDEHVPDDSILAAGVVALERAKTEADTSAIRTPPRWNWGTKGWHAMVRRAIREARGRDAVAQALLVLKCPPNMDASKSTRAGACTRYIDTQTPDHPGYGVFMDLFTAKEVELLRALGGAVPAKDWEYVFNEVTWAPTPSKLNSVQSTLQQLQESSKRNKRGQPNAKTARKYCDLVMPGHNRHARDWTWRLEQSSFRQQARLGDAKAEALVIRKLSQVLPRDTVFAPDGSVVYMLRNVPSATDASASKAEQVMHYDFEPGLERLSVLIALTDHVYLAVGNRWAQDFTKVWRRVPIPKGAAMIFSSNLPHGGMGDVGLEGCERLHLYVGFGCGREQVRPQGRNGNLNTYIAAFEQRPRTAS